MDVEVFRTLMLRTEKLPVFPHSLEISVLNTVN